MLNCFPLQAWRPRTLLKRGDTLYLLCPSPRIALRGSRAPRVSSRLLWPGKLSVRSAMSFPGSPLFGANLLPHNTNSTCGSSRGTGYPLRCQISAGLVAFWASKCNLIWHCKPWQDTVCWALNSLSGDDFSQSIARFSFAALCHLIWKTRNDILF